MSLTYNLCDSSPARRADTQEFVLERWAEFVRLLDQGASDAPTHIRTAAPLEHVTAVIGEQGPREHASRTNPCLPGPAR
jgi:hypothetical protein